MAAHAQSLSLVPEKIPPVISDRQDFQIPDRVHLTGWMGTRIHVNEVNRLVKLDPDRLLEGFRSRPGRHKWDGEHLGKWMHATTLAWANTGNSDLRAKLDYAAAELIKCQLPDGYLGTYVDAERWTEWDVWSHKYNLIGLITYMRYTGNMEPLPTCRRVGDLLCNTFGNESGKRDIIPAGIHMGMAPTSVLEPMVWLYRMTGEQRYLDFCKYILRAWEQPNGPKIISTLLKEKRVDRVGNNKAYEMLSCINGALEYHRTVGEPKILEAALHAWQDIVDKRLYITGTTSYREFFHADYNLPNVNNVGETCVTVTWIQFNAHLLRLTGEARFAEQIERTVLNQLFGSQHPDGSAWGYYVQMQGKKPYNPELDGHCCGSSGPRGIALIPTFAVSADADGVVVNLYDSGTATLTLPERGIHAASTDESESSVELKSNAQQQATLKRPEGRAPAESTAVTITTDTRYPSDERIRITVAPARPETFAVKLRIPSWCENPVVQVNGKNVETRMGKDGYAAIHREWKIGDEIQLRFKLEPRLVVGDFKNEGKVAVLHGPLVLAADEALLGGKGRELNAIGVAGPKLATLRVTPQAAPTDLKSWPRAQVFRINAVARPPLDSQSLLTSAATVKKDAPLQIGLVPFADAGAGGSAYKIWLPYGQIRPSRNLLLDGIEIRSRRPNHGSVIDEFQTVSHTRNVRRWPHDFYGVELEEANTVARIVFVHGFTGQDGGWFDSSDGKPRIEIKSKPDGEWEFLCELKNYPATTATDAAGLADMDRILCDLEKPIEVFGIRVIGKAAHGNNPKQNWTTCAELQAFGVRRLEF
jgi:uncharacterized protein